MFQAKRRGWKHLAASLMLLPGLTAVGAEMVYLLGTARSQERSSNTNRSATRPTSGVKPTNEDPRMLVKRAREALDNGRLDTALDLARQAEANERGTEWKIFEDTPKSLLKDVQAALSRRDRATAERLLSQSRALADKPAGTNEQRALNLDKARSMCLEAMQLHGSYSMWHFGERPESLLKDIDNARAKLNIAPPKSAPTPVETVRKERPKFDYYTPPSTKNDPVASAPRPAPKVEPYAPPQPKNRDVSLGLKPKDSGPEYYIPPQGWDTNDQRPLPKFETPGKGTTQASYDVAAKFPNNPAFPKNLGPEYDPSARLMVDPLSGGTVVSKPVAVKPSQPAGQEPIEVEPSATDAPARIVKKVEPMQPPVEVPEHVVKVPEPDEPPKIDLAAIAKKQEPLAPPVEVPERVDPVPAPDETPKIVKKQEPLAPPVEVPPAKDPVQVVKTPTIEDMPRLVPPQQPSIEPQPMTAPSKLPATVMRPPLHPLVPRVSPRSLPMTEIQPVTEIVKSTPVLEETPPMPVIAHPLAPRVSPRSLPMTEIAKATPVLEEMPPMTEITQPLPQPAADPAEKLKAVELMQTASALQKGERYVEARQALAEAQKLNASFGPDEDTPELAMQSLAATAHKRINKLCQDAHQTMVRQTPNDVAAAEKLLGEADAIVTGFGFDPWAIGEHRDSLAVIKRKMANNLATIKTPIETPPTITAQKAPTPLDPQVAAEPADPGIELLKQARLEMSHSQLDSARKIAAQVLNTQSKYKDQAQALIRTIDAEETAQKQKIAILSYERGVDALYAKNYDQALSIFKLIEPTLLPASKQRLMNDQMVTAQRQLDKVNNVAQAGNSVPTELAPPEKNGADSLVKQEEAMRELQFQKLRAEGLQLEAAATTRFGKGETDAAMNDLNNFVARVKSSNIDPAKVALLTRPVESRIDKLKVLKHQQDFLTKESKDLKNFRNEMSQAALHDSHKKQEVAKLMKEFGKLMDEGKFQEAGKVAMQARQLDPDDPTTGAAMQISRMAYRKDKWENIKDEKEGFNYVAGNDAHTFGPPVDGKDPIKFDAETFNRIKSRTNAAGGYGSMRSLSEAEKKIESKLNTMMVNLDFNKMPLDEVVKFLQTYTGLNFMLDTKALQQERIDPATTPITLKLTEISLKSALVAIMRSDNLKYVVDNDLIRITTPKGARGKLVQRTIPVADLVIPVQNYQPAAISSLEDALTRSLRNNHPQLPGGASTPFTPSMGLGTTAGTQTGTASLASNGGRPGGALNNQYTPGTGSGVKISGASGTIEESLIRLITSSVQPDTWEAMGGAGRIEYYPLGMALVINQTPDVIEEVGRLLEALRQLQDLEIAIEVRMITLAETFYERIGLDFSMNIDTHNSRAASQLGNSSASNNNLTNIQNLPGASKVVGLAVPGVPTPDLNLPITATSFGLAIPPFGNFPNAPGADGGLSLGLAFLSDIQVQMFLEAAQGDRRTNVMQAPKLTMFNGQSANIQIQDQQFFLTGITVTSVNGQLVFTPQNQPFPLGVQMNMQPVVSGDRRFVRLNIQQQMTNLASATVPLFPITTIVTPVFEGGAQGQPVPFTQYIQQPTFSTISVSTTVVVPDGGTVLLGGLKTLNEGRNEFGPPVLSKIPYVSRLFRNVGYGREAQSLMMMVTPRIIINREEQERQTGVVEFPPN